LYKQAFKAYFCDKNAPSSQIEIAKFPSKNAPSSQTELCQTAEQIIAKLRNKSSPNCGTKFRQIAEKFQKYLHMSVIFTTFAAFFQKITNYGRL